MHRMIALLAAALIAGCASAPPAEQPAKGAMAKAPTKKGVSPKKPMKKAAEARPKGPPKLPDDLKALDDEAAGLRVRAQRAAIEIDRALADALALYRQKQFPEAVKRLTRAQEIIRWLEIRIPGQAERATRINDLLVQVQRDGTEFKRQQQVAQLTEMKRRRRAREQERSNRLRERVARLTREASFNFRREAYDDAATLYREALRLDPTNEDLTKLLENSRLAHHRKVNDNLRRNLVRQKIATRIRTDQSSLPQHAVTLFPPEEVWREVTKRRPAGNSYDFGERPPEIVKITEKLKKRISVDFSETPLADVVQFLRETLGVNMMVDPKLVRERGPDELTIDMKLKDVEAANALKLMCDLRNLRYKVTNGVIFITSKD